MINIIIHQIIMSVIFLTGIIVFSIQSFNQNFTLSLIVLTITGIIVNLYGVFTKSLSQRSIVYILSSIIVLISISVFGNYGIEQKAVGYETLYDFSLNGIAISLVLFFLASSILILGIYKPIIKAKLQKIAITPLVVKKQELKPIIESEDWEEANIEDLKSGEYQII